MENLRIAANFAKAAFSVVRLAFSKKTLVYCVEEIVLPQNALAKWESLMIMLIICVKIVLSAVKSV